MANTPRELVYRTLLAAERDSSRAIDDLLSDALQHSALGPRDKAWSMEIVYGVTRMRLQLDAWIQTAYKGRYKKAQHSIKTLLRIGVFQLKYMQTADHAAPLAPQAQAARQQPVTSTPSIQRDGSDPDEMILNPDYSFDNFVTGHGNDLAYA
ncbi:MAG: hypothetical protein L3J79_04115, partial [Candidatus Marinimicrobia bacterium]|nr:hypothetical protein [Candidatus Neomarinimicrobiota bacterium]